MTRQHVMIDIETMGDGPNAPILSIGAVKFDKENGITNEHYSACSIESALDSPGAEPSGGTIKWWLQQSEEARSQIVAHTGTHTAMLVEFGGWMKLQGRLDGVWGNGATFDNVIVASAFKRNDLSVPWAFWLDKCYRTIKSTPLGRTVKLDRKGVHHNALDDAKSQAEHLLAINAKAKGAFL